jgi:Spy/CpxP family protein refolding chaperone
MRETQIDDIRDEIYLDKYKRFEELLTPEQKALFYELEALREEIEESTDKNIKTPA